MLFISRILRTVLMAAFVLAATSASLLAQVVVTGVARQPDGSPVVAATVTLTPQNVQTQTDASGTYRFEGVTPGVWSRISVKPPLAKQPLASRVALITLPVEHVDIQVQPGGSSLDVSGGAGGIRGVVLSSDGLSIPGATIAIDGSDYVTIGDAAGAFSFVELQTNQQVTLLVSASGFGDARREITVPAGPPVTANVTLGLGRVAQAVTVPGDVPMLTAPGSGALTVRAQDAAALPAIGRADPLQLVRLLPGADGTQEATVGLSVRGGTPGDSLLTFDGLPLFTSDHLFGYVGALNPDAVDRVEFAADLLDPAMGNRLTGSMHVVGKAQESERSSGYADVGGLSSGGMLSVPVGRWGSFLVAGRRSTPTPLYQNLAGLFSSNGVQFKSAPDSSFDDLNGKVSVRASARDRVAVTAVNARDTVDANGTRGVSTLVSNLTYVAGVSSLSDGADGMMMTVGRTRRLQNRGTAVSWDRLWNDRAQTSVDVGRSTSSDERVALVGLTDVLTGQDDSYAVGRGAAGAWSGRNDVEETRVHVRNTLAVGSAHVISAGGELSRVTASYDATMPAAALSPDGTYQPVTIGLLSRQATGQVLSGFVSERWTPRAGLTLAPGMRVSRYDVTGESAAEPRVTGTLELRPGLLMTGSYGHSHQYLTSVTQEDLWQGGRDFWTLADGAQVPVARSRRATAGTSYRTRNVLVDLTLFRTTLDDVTVFAPRLTPGDVPPTTALFAGSQVARGAELLFQQRAGRQSGWISYTLSDVQQRFASLEANAFAAPQDERHRIKVVESVALFRHWTMAGVWVFGSGRPYTPATGIESVALPVGLTVDSLTFGTTNSARLPAYHRLDASVQNTFHALGIRGTAGATLFNVYDRPNVWYRSYQTFAGLATSSDVTYLTRAVNAFVKIGF